MSRYSEIKEYITGYNNQLKADNYTDDQRFQALNQELMKRYNIDLDAYTEMYRIEQESRAEALDDPLEFLANSARQMFQGTTLGFGEHIEAYIRKRFADLVDLNGDREKSFEQIVFELQAGIKGFEEANPKWSFATELMGGLYIPGLGTATNLTRLATSKALKYTPVLAGKAPKVMPKTTEAITQTTVGAGLGAGYEKGKTGEVTTQGVVLGGGLGVGGYYAGQGIRKGLDKIPKTTPLIGPLASRVKGGFGSGDVPPEDPVVDNPITNRLKNEVTVTGEPERLANKRMAMKLFLDELVKEDLTIDELINRINQYRVNNKIEETTIYDLVSKMDPRTGEALREAGPLQDLLMGTKLNSPGTAGRLSEQYKTRQLFAKERGLDDLKKLFKGLVKGKETKYASVEGFKNEMIEATQKQTKPLYEKVEPLKIENPDLIQKIQTFINSGEDTIKAVGTAQRNYGRINRGKEMQQDPSTWDIEMFDAYKKAVDDIASEYFEKLANSSGKSLNDSLQVLLRDVDDLMLNPMFSNTQEFAGTNPYKLARELYVDADQANKAYALGAKGLSNVNREELGLEQFKFAFDNLPNERAKRYTILGLFNALYDAVYRIPTRKAPDVRFVTQGGAPPMVTQDKIRYALANINLTKAGRKSVDKKLKDFERSQAIENNFLTNFNTLIRGSRTPEKLASKERFADNTEEFVDASAEVMTTGRLPVYAITKGLSARKAKAKIRQLEKLSDSLSNMMLKQGEGPMTMQLEELRDFQRQLNMYTPQRFRSATQNPLMYSLLDERR